MTNEEIHSTIFNQEWTHCTFRLVDGDVITVNHPDYLFMPPERNWILWVKPQGQGLQFVPSIHVAAIEIESKAPRVID